ncbi:hypothetical protein Leryth_015992 [Lithospermum erythrorhizon]|nr:hypothetical protein Leryth_015992 [Lithospermum erythrorhizon]
MGGFASGISIDNPVLVVTPVPIAVLSPLGSKEVVSCERVAVSGLSRLKIGSLHSIHRVTLVPSVVIPEKLHSKIQICFHRNSSLGSCQCEDDDWRSLHKGVWTTIISPYEDRYIDLKFMDDISGSATVTVEVEFQRWRLFCLALGIVLWLLAPIVSSWVPFYYSSSMAIGVFLVVIILLFQGMKLLPTGRKILLSFRFQIQVSAGSFLLHQLSVLVNSILSSFGLSDEMHSSVTIFLLVFNVLPGAGLGTRDTPLATVLVCCCMTIRFLVTSISWSNFSELPHSVPSMFLEWRTMSPNMRHQGAEFYSPTGMGSRGRLKRIPNGTPITIYGQVTKGQQDFYSTFHKTPERKKFSKKEWDKFTQQSLS